MALVLSERRGAVAILTLNNPAQYNAITEPLLADLRAACDAAQDDDGVRAIMLTGAGKGFCSGAQLGGDMFGRMTGNGDDVASMITGALNPILEQMRRSPIPIVVGVNGAAAGAGVGLALAGDIVIAARSARFILSFSRLGAVLDGGTSVLLQRAIGAPRARALALLGEPISARRPRFGAWYGAASRTASCSSRPLRLRKSWHKVPPPRSASSSRSWNSAGARRSRRRSPKRRPSKRALS